MRLTACFLLVVIFATPPVFAESSVWVASKDGNKIYLGGTIHVLSANDYPLPDEFDQAYKKSDQLVFETNIKDANSPEFQMQMMSQLSYADGKSLRSELSPEAYSELEKFCDARNIPLAAMNILKPQLVVVALLGVELLRMGMITAGVDEHFYQRAIKDKKTTQFLESVSQQLDILVNMGKGKEDQLILNTVRDLNNIDSLMSEMKTAWRTGDQKKFEQVALAPMQNEFPDLYQSLLVKRNTDWMKYIKKMLTTSEVEFVLVGALHLVGEDGVLQKLKNLGYQVTQLH